jgi:hypothetical protein
MVALNISGLDTIRIDSYRDVADLFYSPNSADDTSPLILYSPAGAWTDSPSNDTGASVRLIQRDILTFHTPDSVPVVLPTVVAHFFFSWCICNYQF